MLKHVAQICTEFYKIVKIAAWWEGKTFRNPTTGKTVKFKSLSPEEQKRLNALHKEKSSKQTEKQKARLEKIKERELRRKTKKEERARKKKEQEDTFKNMTPETHPNYFTDNGKRLDTRHGFRPGWKVEKNPDWDPKKDESFYAKEYNPKTGKAVHYYTEDYMRKHNKVKFANVKRFGELLPEIRAKCAAALTSDNPRDRTYSTAIALVDQAAMRVGNKKSEEDDVRGLHSLQVRHIKITPSSDNKSTVELNYTGKAKQAQKHEFEVSPVIAKNLNELIQNKGPDDHIFTWVKDEKPLTIAPRLINKFLKRQLGSNVTIHKFRHHHATEKVKSFLDQVNTDKINIRDVKLAINDASEYAAEYLGNTAKVARQHYVDPTIWQEFLKRANIKRSLKEVLKGKASSNSMLKQAGKFNLKFTVDENLKGLTPEEQTFQDNIEAMKLEELQPYEGIDFENADIENLKL